jgi:hypothetical protein
MVLELSSVVCRLLAFEDVLAKVGSVLIHCFRGFTYVDGYMVRGLYVLYIFKFRSRDVPYV